MTVKEFLLVGIGLLLPIMSASLMAQKPQCKVGVDTAPVGFWTWAPASKIEVYVVDADFEEKEIPYLLTPLTNWNRVSEVTGSNVKFDYKGTTTTPLHCQNCLTIVRGKVFDKTKRHLTELRTYSAGRDRIMTWATIVVDPLLANPKTLTNALAHELGHSFGLLDCYSCKPNSSVMIQFKEVNVPNEMAGPSSCDVAQVRNVYQAVALQLKRAPKQKPVIVDEGEEPVDDDTPIVVPKP